MKEIGIVEELLLLLPKNECDLWFVALNSLELIEGYEVLSEFW